MKTYSTKYLDYCPYIVTQINDSIQTEIIFGSDFLSIESNSFLKKVFSSKAISFNELVMKVFEFNNMICFSAQLPNEVVENRSDRKGLPFVIGFLLSIDFVKKVHMPIWTYLSQFLLNVKNIFGYDLINGGSDDFLRYLRETDIEIVNTQFSIFENVMLNPFPFFRKNDFFKMKNYFLIVPKIYKKKSHYSKVVLVNQNADKLFLIKTFLMEVDAMLVSNNYKIPTISSYGYENEDPNSLSVKILNCLPSDIIHDQYSEAKIVMNKKDNILVIQLI